MIIENQAKDIAPDVVDCAHKVEILCPACNRDVDASELAAQKCSDCGTDLSNPQQNVSIAVTSLPVFAVVF